MFRRLLNSFRTHAGVLYSFGGSTSREMIDAIVVGRVPVRDSEVFPGYVLLQWRDHLGLNPGFTWVTYQFGPRDPHLLPMGFRSIYTGWNLFGDRWNG